MYKSFIFREYDVRGVYEKDFDLDLAKKLGQALVSFVVKKGHKNPLMTVGYDARLSSPAITKAVVEGMQSSGARVLTLGLITTPMSYFSMFSLQAAGGIMVTGSHNPPEYNGFKISFGKTTLFGEEIQELRKIIEANDFVTGAGTSEAHDIFPAYIERYRKEFSHIQMFP